MITGKYAILRCAHRYHNYHTGYHNITDDTFAGMSPRCTLGRMPTPAYFILTLDRNRTILGHTITGAGIYSEASPSVAGDYRYSKPVVITEGLDYAHAARAMRFTLAKALHEESATDLGKMLRDLHANGLLDERLVSP